MTFMKHTFDGPDWRQSLQNDLSLDSFQATVPMYVQTKELQIGLRYSLTVSEMVLQMLKKVAPSISFQQLTSHVRRIATLNAHSQVLSLYLNVVNFSQKFHEHWTTK